MKTSQADLSQDAAFGQTWADGPSTGERDPHRKRGRAWLGQNLETVQRGAKAGRIPARRIGKEWRFLRDRVAEARGLAAGATSSPAEDDLFPRSPFATEDGTASAGMDASEAADFLRVKEWTVRSEANQGRLPGWREGQRWRFSREELIEHMRTDEPADRIRYDRRSARSSN